MDTINNAFLQATLDPSVISMALTSTLENHVMNIQLKVLPYANFTGTKIYMAVIEKSTHNNIFVNWGDAVCWNTTMKMVPDPGGGSR